MKKRALLLLIIVAAAVILLLHPEISSGAVTSALTVCGVSIIPSLFPYFVLTNLYFSLGCSHLLTDKIGRVMQRLFHLPSETGAPFLLGCIAGFPVGAQSAIRLYEEEQITKDDAEQALLFCSNAGPAFIFGVIGARLFQSTFVALCLWLIHLSGALMIGMLLRPPKQSGQSYKLHDPAADRSILSALTDAISQAGNSTLRVCMFIIFFSIAAGYLKAVVPTAWSSKPWFILSLGALELAGGSTMLEGLAQPSAFVIISALLAWNGLCVHCQVLSAIGKKPLSFKKYFLGKSLHILISVTLSCMIAPLLPFQAVCAATESSYSTDFPSIALLIIMGLFIVKTSSGNKEEFRI